MKAFSKIPRRKKGQSVIEFAMVIFIFFFMLSLTFSAVLGFATYQYLSYATFMSARAYQASHQTPEDQERAALRTMATYVRGINSTSFSGSLPFSFGGITLATIRAFRVPNPRSVGFGPGGNPSGNFGILLDFSVPFVRLPLGAGVRSALGTFNMRTLSYLGREVTVEECQSYFESFFSSLPGGSSGTEHTAAGMEDTGC